MILSAIFAAPIPATGVDKFLWEASKATIGLSILAMIPIAAYQTAVYGTRYLVGANTSNVNHRWQDANKDDFFKKMSAEEKQQFLKNNPNAISLLGGGGQPMIMPTGSK